jgi:O-acetyl-ADP-ribose deacetylase (regulator of RNase III)
MIRIIHGNILDQKVDAIVNAANTGLRRGAGVCGAIFARAGYELDSYIAKTYPKGIATGEAVITPGFGCPQKFIIHTAGPVYESAQKSAPLLERSYRASLEVASINRISSIAFPAISTGIFGYPFADATRIALKVCGESPIDVVLVYFSEKEYDEAVRLKREVK